MSIIIGLERMGLHGKPFTLYKFKTMKQGIETVDDRKNGVFFDKYLEKDPRVTTKFMRFMRKGPDELLNIWNIIRGDLTLVGPRPLIRYEYDLLNNLKDGPDIIKLRYGGELDVRPYKHYNWSAYWDVSPGMLGAEYTEPCKNYFEVRLLGLKYAQEKKELLDNGEFGKARWMAIKTIAEVLWKVYITKEVKNS